LLASPALEPVLYVGAGTGPRLAVGPAWGATRACLVSAGARHATVLQILDVDAHARVLTTPSPIWGADAGFRVHPLFLFLFHESGWADALAALNLRLGLGLQGNGAGVRAIWSWGLGVDVPLNDPDDGASWWLGAELGDFRGLSSVEALEPGDVTALSLTLEYRINAL
jgi:hypothetical protein